MTKFNWLSRCLIQGPPFGLCTDQQTLDKLMNESGVREETPLVNPGAHATTHTVSPPGQKTCYIVGVSLEVVTSQPYDQLAGLLTHEATHIWRYFCRDIGEYNPSAEFECYAIQHFTQQLFQEALRVRRKKLSELTGSSIGLKDALNRFDDILAETPPQSSEPLTIAFYGGEPDPSQP